MLLLAGLYVVAIGLRAAVTPLWFDEIITYQIANLGGPRTIVEALLAKADNHPPLDYIARHYAMAVFGGSELAFRLPSIVAMLVASLCLYLIVLRRTSVLPALAAFSFPFVTVAVRYASEGRGYAFLMASVCLAFLAWQRAAEKPTPVRLLFLLLCLSVGPYCHYYGVLNYGPIVIGEAWRSWENRKISWPIAGCILLSLVSLGLLVPFAIRATEFAPNFWVRFGPTSLVQTYTHLLSSAIPAIAASLIVVALLSLSPAAGPSARGGEPTALPRHEVVAAIALSLLPIATYVLALLVTRAFDQRYVLNTVFGVALLLAYLIHEATSRRPRYAQAVTLVFALWAAGTLVLQAPREPAKPYAIRSDFVEVIEASPLPVVVPDYHAYLRHRLYLPEALRSRLYYVADLGFAVKYERKDTSDRMLLNLRPFMQANVVPFCDFVKRHPRFLMLTGENGWLFPKLIEDRAQVSILAGSAPAHAILSVTLERPGNC
jgi:uncharacterized membrane protein